MLFDYTFGYTLKQLVGHVVSYAMDILIFIKKVVGDG